MWKDSSLGVGTSGAGGGGGGGELDAFSLS